ncbi:MAG: ASPIC/UnbV domain-containing protein [Bryobacteraceae bacterium]
MLFFGLGNCATVDSIDVRWPNKSLSTDHYANVPAGNLVELHQGDSTAYGVVLGH